MRKFNCPFCGFRKNFYGEEARRFKKKVLGLTCPKCGKKVTEDDIRKIKGRGPKPLGERRKRVKKEVVRDTSPIVIHPNVEQFEWRTSGPSPPGDPRIRSGWQPKPTTRTIEEVLVEAHLSKKIPREVSKTAV